MLRTPLICLLAIMAAAGATAVAACSASFDSMGGDDPQYPNGGSGGAGCLDPDSCEDAGIDGTVGSGGGVVPSGFSDLCGQGCLPGTGEAEPCSLAPAGEGGGGAGGAAPEPGDGAGGGNGGGTEAGGGSGGGTAAVQGYCQLAAVLSEGAGGTGPTAYAEGACAPVGESTDGMPCLSAADCAAGFGCVQEGVCRAYCCGSLEDCPLEPKTFCAPVRMAAGDMVVKEAAAPPIPVCIPVEDCTLLTEDPKCAEQGKICTVVRLDGTTSCAEPGTGSMGESCPCADGHICSFGIDTCLKLCHVDQQSECPSDYQCAGGNKQLPAGVGVCQKL